MKVKGILTMLGVAVLFILLIPFASSYPDGLENAMEKFSVAEKAIYNAPLSYGDTFTQSLLMALVGMAVVCALAMGIAYLSRRSSA